MASLITRVTSGTGCTVKNSTLTNTEVDTNFINLNNDIATRLPVTGGTNLYLGTAATTVRFPFSNVIISNVTTTELHGEVHNIGVIAEAQSSSLTKTFTAGNAGEFTVTVNSVTGLYVGMGISGTGIGGSSLITGTDNTITNINTGTNVLTVSTANSGAVSGTATFKSYGIGLYGIGYTYGSGTASGVVGEGFVTDPTDTGWCIGVRGYSNHTHTAGYNIGLYGDAGNSTQQNFSLYLSHGNMVNVYTATWYLGGNLTFASYLSSTPVITIPTLSLTNALTIANGGTGTTSFYTNGVLLGNGTGAIQSLPYGTLDNVLHSTGSAWESYPISSLITNTRVISAIGFTPYNATNPSGFISGITSGMVTTALGFTPYNSANLPAGTRIPFAQASAPTGWTQDTTDTATNRMLRVTNSTGGGVAGTDSPIIHNTVSAHTHVFTGTPLGNHTHTDAGHSHSYTFKSVTGGTLAGGDPQSVGSTAYNTGTGYASISSNSAGTPAGTIATNAGSADWQPRYIDMIICTKN